MKRSSTEWVSLAEAAALLGAHPATVRSWADRGLLPSQRTPGGHRRFRRADLEYVLDTQAIPSSSEAQLLVQSAVGRARVEIGEGHFAGTDWYRKLDDAARAEMRLYGRRLMDVLQHFLASATSAELADARHIGLHYGQAIRARGLTLSQAAEGFFTFHDALIESSLQITEIHHTSAERNEAVRKIYAFTREIILALIDSYERGANP